MRSSPFDSPGSQGEGNTTCQDMAALQLQLAQTEGDARTLHQRCRKGVISERDEMGGCRIIYIYTYIDGIYCMYTLPIYDIHYDIMYLIQYI